MAVKAYPAGEWLPDLAPAQTHLSEATNVFPIANGYAPVSDFSDVTTALDATFTGGGAFIGSDGTASLLSATATDLYRYASNAWSSVLTEATTSRYRFAQFGDNVIYANGGTLGSYDLVAQTAAAIASAPTAYDVATVRDFVVALGVDGDELSVGWSAFNNSASWPMDGTDQSDLQPLLDGGKGIALVGGEYGLILQKNAVRRMTYTGGETIFQIDKISGEVGCMAQGSVANVGRLVFFLSERGFQMCDGEGVTPIGDEKFNRWFFGTYSREQIETMWAAIDPRRSIVMWAMPASPGRIICYNWVLNRASVIEIDVAALFTGFTSNIDLDSIGDVDAISGSLDDPIYAGGNPLLLVVNNSNVIGTLAGDNLAATVTIPNVEPSPGRRSRIRGLRPITDATNATATIRAKMRAGDTDGTVSASVMRSNGKMPIRCNGRYNDVSLTIPAAETWEFVSGIELEYEPGDGR